MSASRRLLCVILASIVGISQATTAYANSAQAASTDMLAGDASSPSLEQMVKEDRVRLKSWIQPASGGVIGQQLELNIEVATDSWFSGGSHVGRFELDDAIVLRRNKFAVNSSRRESGTTWSVQLWTITIYPQRAGRFSLPPIELSVSIANPDAPTSAISGVLQTKQMEFLSLLPDEIRTSSVTQWIASTYFSVSDEFDKPLNSDADTPVLRVGDAIRRTITLRAENVAAMMLPAINISSTPGLAAYMRPARLEDRVNRGTYIALRREVVSYVAEEAGSYTLPAIAFHWWNTRTSDFEQIHLPAQPLLVGMAGSPNDSSRQSFWSSHMLLWLAAIGMTTLVLAVAVKKLKTGGLLSRLLAIAYPPDEQLKRRLIRDYRSEDAAAHSFKVLDWLGSKGLKSEQSVRLFITEQANPDVLTLFNTLMQHAFHNGATPVTNAEFKFLITELDLALRDTRREQEPRETQLNPRPGNA